MRTLYHFRHSPFSRRTRLALAFKGLDCELREARESPAWLEEARQLVPFRTIPVLVDGDRAMGDSMAIAQWIDRAYPGGPRLWPDGADSHHALQTAALVDVVLDNVIDLGTRYYALREHAAWSEVKEEMLGRARRAADALAERTDAMTAAWSAQAMWLFTLTAWFESLPSRTQASPNVAQVVSLGFVLPPSLSKWADAHRRRPDVEALDRQS